MKAEVSSHGGNRQPRPLSPLFDWANHSQGISFSPDTVRMRKQELDPVAGSLRKGPFVPKGTEAFVGRLKVDLTVSGRNRQVAGNWLGHKFRQIYGGACTEYGDEKGGRFLARAQLSVHAKADEQQVWYL